MRRGRPDTKFCPCAAGLTACVAGLGAIVAGMSAFNGARQVTGTDPGDLQEGGVYRYSRNPQYVGFVLAGAAGTVARRSVPAAALTAGYAAVCAWWCDLRNAACMAPSATTTTGTSDARRAGSVTFASERDSVRATTRSRFCGGGPRRRRPR